MFALEHLIRSVRSGLGTKLELRNRSLCPRHIRFISRAKHFKNSFQGSSLTMSNWQSDIYPDTFATWYKQYYNTNNRKCILSYNKINSQISSNNNVNSQIWRRKKFSILHDSHFPGTLHRRSTLGDAKSIIVITLDLFISFINSFNIFFHCFSFRVRPNEEKILQPIHLVHSRVRYTSKYLLESCTLAPL